MRFTSPFCCLLLLSCWLSSAAQNTISGKLIWSDEFEGKSLDFEKWKFETGSHGWGNNEWQDYQEGPSNVVVNNGVLSIIAKKTGSGQKVGDYTSARLNSKVSFTYGRIEVRAKIPDHKGNGLWPAIWMLGKNIAEVGWPDCGEIDIMEYVSYDPDHVHQTIHTKANNHMIGNHIASGPVALPSLEESFHTYCVLWEPNKLTFYVDDPQNVLLEVVKPTKANQDNWPFDKPFYFLLNMAVGGDWGGLKGVDDSIFPAQLEIDYVRVYEISGQ